MKKLLALFAVALFATAGAQACTTGRFTVDGTWNGWTGSTVFLLTGGQVFKQTEYHYHYEYAYRPEVIIFTDGGQCMAKIGNAQPVGVRQAR